MRWWAKLVMLYMLAAIVWWGVLLYQKNNALYEIRLQNVASHSEETRAGIEAEYQRQSYMIVGEGIVLGVSLIFALWLINRSVRQQLIASEQQHNFLISISHELKTPITSIKLGLQTLLRRSLQPDMQQKLINNAVRDADRLEGMVQNVLLSANLDGDHFSMYYEPLDITALVEHTVQTYQRAYPEAEIVFDTERMIWETDKNALQVIVSNLLSNALKYSPPNGQVSIQMEKMDSALRMTISDQGIGISDEDKTLVTNRFYRSQDPNVRKIVGTGLGLYICAEMVRRLKGDIKIQDNTPKGTKIVIILPKHKNV